MSQCVQNMASSRLLNRQAVSALCLLLICRRRRKQLQQRRKWWIHPVMSDRSARGKFVLLHHKLMEYPDKFLEYYRMTINSFKILLSLVEDTICKTNTVMRESVSAEERLAVTLRYLGTGNSFRSLDFEFLLGRSTVASIIRDTCVAIWEVLREEFMKEPSVEDWMEISEKYERRANFPHCVGSIDGKHIRIIKPWGSGSEFFNYKKFFSIVLVAVADSDYCFRYIDVGGFGHEGDSNLFKATELGKRVYSQSLHLPQPRRLPNEQNGQPVPFVFVADEAFALGEHVLRPFPAKNLTHEKKVFNYRLSRARRFVECAFGILANKWRVLHRPLDVSVDLSDTIVKACCILHNFVKKQDGYNFEDALCCSLESVSAHGTRGNRSGKQIRDYFANYFCSTHGSVPWQDRFV